MSLPSVPSAMINELEKLFFKFIWNDKPDKIKRTTTYKTISDGGLGMINLKAFQQALHITWIRRLVNPSNATWKLMIKSCYPQLREITSFGPEYCKLCIQKTNNVFWCSVLQDYRSYSLSYNTDKTNTHAYEPLFYNPKLNIHPRLNGSIALQKAGIFLAYQIIDWDEKSIMSNENIYRLYSVKLDFISYKNLKEGIKPLTNHNQLLECNPQEIKNTIHTCYAQNVLKDEKGTKNIMKELLDEKDFNTMAVRWQKDYFTNIDWQKAYDIVQKSLNCTRLKWLQIRILHRIITTNKSVSKYKLEQVATCTFCRKTEETICHLFIDCEIVKDFWKALETIIGTKCVHSSSFVLSREIILFGTSATFKSTQSLDLIIVMAKMHIYKHKVNNTKPKISNFITEVKQRYEQEKYNAIISNNNNKHANKWLSFMPMIEEKN